MQGERERVADSGHMSSADESRSSSGEVIQGERGGGASSESLQGGMGLGARAILPTDPSEPTGDEASRVVVLSETDEREHEPSGCSSFGDQGTVAEGLSGTCKHGRFANSCRSSAHIVAAASLV